MGYDYTKYKITSYLIIFESHALTVSYILQTNLYCFKRVLTNVISEQMLNLDRGPHYKYASEGISCRF